MKTGSVVAVSWLWVAGQSLALAAMSTPIVDRSFTIDLYQGAVQGSPRTTSMGGTTIALSEGALGILGNTASAAMRPPSCRDRWDWDFAVDGFAPGLGSDFDNK